MSGSGGRTGRRRHRRRGALQNPPRAWRPRLKSPHHRLKQSTFPVLLRSGTLGVARLDGREGVSGHAPHLRWSVCGPRLDTPIGLRSGSSSRGRRRASTITRRCDPLRAVLLLSWRREHSKDDGHREVGTGSGNRTPGCERPGREIDLCESLVLLHQGLRVTQHWPELVRKFAAAKLWAAGLTSVFRRRVRAECDPAWTSVSFACGPVPSDVAQRRGSRDPTGEGFP